MIKKISTLSAALLLSLTLFAQTWTGGVKGTVVNRAGYVPPCVVLYMIAFKRVKSDSPLTGNH